MNADYFVMDVYFVYGVFGRNCFFGYKKKTEVASKILNEDGLYKTCGKYARGYQNTSGNVSVFRHASGNQSSIGMCLEGVKFTKEELGSCFLIVY